MMVARNWGVGKIEIYCLLGTEIYFFKIKTFRIWLVVLATLTVLYSDIMGKFSNINCYRFIAIFNIGVKRIREDCHLDIFIEKLKKCFGYSKSTIVNEKNISSQLCQYVSLLIKWKSVLSWQH